MKIKFKIGTLATAMLLYLGLGANGQGIEFFQGGFDEAMAKAKAENKNVFIDFYADWCGPCKMMVSDVFPDAELGEYFNNRFVSVQLDTESPENQALVKRFNIKSIPTLVFLSNENQILTQNSGAMPVEGLLRQARIATGEAPKFTDVYDRYRASKNDLALAQELLQEAPGFVATLDSEMEYNKWVTRIERIFSDYYKAKMGPDIINSEDYRIILTFHPEPKANDQIAEFIVANIQEYLDKVGTGPAYYVIQYNDAVLTDLARSGKTEYKKWLARISGDMAPAYAVLPKGTLTPEARNTYLFDAEYLLFAKKDAQGYVELMNKYLEDLGQDANSNTYAQAAQKIFNAMGGKVPASVIEQAKDWTLKALEIDDAPLLDRINYMAMLGDNYRELKNYAEARKSYNQAYLESFQLSEGRMQVMVQMSIKRKLSQLELLENK